MPKGKPPLEEHFDAQACREEWYLICRRCKKGYVIPKKVSPSTLIKLREHLEIHEP